MTKPRRHQRLSRQAWTPLGTATPRTRPVLGDVRVLRASRVRSVQLVFLRDSLATVRSNRVFVFVVRRQCPRRSNQVLQTVEAEPVVVLGAPKPAAPLRSSKSLGSPYVGAVGGVTRPPPPGRMSPGTPPPGPPGPAGPIPGATPSCGGKTGELVVIADWSGKFTRPPPPGRRRYRRLGSYRRLVWKPHPPTATGLYVTRDAATKPSTTKSRT